MAGEVSREGETRREDDARRRNPSPFRLLPQPDLDFVVGGEKPEHAALDLPQHAHPDVEHLRVDLVAVVETTEEQRVARQSQVLTAGNGGRGSDPESLTQNDPGR